MALVCEGEAHGLLNEVVLSVVHTLDYTAPGLHTDCRLRQLHFYSHLKSGTSVTS